MTLYVCNSDNVVTGTKSGYLPGLIQAKLGAPAVEESAIWALIHEEYSLLPASAMLVDAMEALRRRFKESDNQISVPPGSAFADAVAIKDVESIRDLHKVETLLAGYLNICYGVIERIKTATKLLYKLDSRIWTDVIEDPKKRYEGLDRFERLLAGFYDGRQPGPKELVRRIINTWRGSRTHATHFQAFATGPKVEFTFADRNPYQGVPELEFTEHELRSASQFLGLFVAWWVGRTEIQLNAI